MANGKNDMPFQVDFLFATVSDSLTTGRTVGSEDRFEGNLQCSTINYRMDMDHKRRERCY